MNCPKCGADEYEEDCGSFAHDKGFYQSDYCREREAHTATKAKLADLVSALEHLVHVVGHNSCTTGTSPNGFAVALDHGRRVLAKLRGGAK